MKSLCIIPCGSKKIWDKHPNIGPVKAKSVYIGSFATLCRQYAEKFYPESWCIFPEEIITGPYNVTFNDKKTNPISTNELLKQVKAKNFDQYDEFIVIAGKNYVKVISEVLNPNKMKLPVKDYSGMGYIMSALKSAIDLNSTIKL